jgi:ferritin-like metal-binding protein YciE
MKDFHDLFTHEIRDMYAAELQIEKILPVMVEKAHNPKLKEAFNTHHKETKDQIKRLEKISAQLNVNLNNCECDAISGILKEGKKLSSEHYPPEVLDAALIISAQRVEHYEMAVYGGLKAFAKHLKLDEVLKLLDESSKEEGHADKKLTEIAEGTPFSSGVNVKAIKQRSA